MLNLGMLHDNGSGTNIFKADQFFKKKMVRGTNIFSENFGPRTIISGTNFPVTDPLHVQVIIIISEPQRCSVY